MKIQHVSAPLVCFLMLSESSIQMRFLQLVEQLLSCSAVGHTMPYKDASTHWSWKLVLKSPPEHHHHHQNTTYDDHHQNTAAHEEEEEEEEEEEDDDNDDDIEEEEEEEEDAVAAWATTESMNNGGAVSHGLFGSSSTDEVEALLRSWRAQTWESKTQGIICLECLGTMQPRLEDDDMDLEDEEEEEEEQGSKEGEKEDMICQLPCNHPFHEECIRRWFEVRDTCPLCRTTLHV